METVICPSTCLKDTINCPNAAKKERILAELAMIGTSYECPRPDCNMFANSRGSESNGVCANPK